MKKFSFISSVLLLTAVVAFLFIGCQKDTTTTETPASENINIKAIAGEGGFAGSINGDYAEALKKNYINKFGNYDGNDDKELPLKVAFSAKDLIAFINTLRTKNNSDVVYVNFGVYGKGAPAVDQRNNGRLTVFFTGNNLQKDASTVKTNGTNDSGNDYMNHGDIIPTPTQKTP